MQRSIQVAQLLLLLLVTQYAFSTATVHRVLLIATLGSSRSVERIKDRLNGLTAIGDADSAMKDAGALGLFAISNSNISESTDGGRSLLFSRRCWVDIGDALLDLTGKVVDVVEDVVEVVVAIVRAAFDVSISALEALVGVSARLAAKAASEFAKIADLFCEILDIKNAVTLVLDFILVDESTKRFKQASASVADSTAGVALAVGEGLLSVGLGCSTPAEAVTDTVLDLIRLPRYASILVGVNRLSVSNSVEDDFRAVDYVLVNI